METSIQHIAKEFLLNMQNITHIISDEGIDSYSDKALEECKACAKRFAEEYVRLLNQNLRESKVFRKKNGLILQEKSRKREIYTKLGLIDVSRDYYKLKDGSGYEYPLDTVVGIESRERISDGLSAELVSNATEDSFAKSVRKAGAGDISRQTVRNKILKAPTLEIEPGDKRENVRELHVFADEDHAHLQKPNKAKGKCNQQVPIVTVTEGIDESKARHKIVEAVNFVDEEFSSKRLWGDVDAYINARYDPECLEKIYLHADGGSWIKNGLENYPNVVHVMDEFHIEKSLKTLGHIDAKETFRLRLAIKDNDINKAKASLSKMMLEYDPGEKEYKSTARLAKYILGNWDAIVRRKTLDIPGSCTESIVSHKLAKRFSRNPQGWSKEVLGKLAKLRIYKENGGEITAKNYRNKTKEAKEKTELRRILSGKDKVADFSLFEIEKPIFDWQNGIQMAIRKLGEMQSI